MSSDSNETSSFIEETWVQWYCNLTGNRFLCEVERTFIEDSFNLFGLKQYVKDYSKALDVILDRYSPNYEAENDEATRGASLLYGLIHARYIITAHGLENMVIIYTLSTHSLLSQPPF